MAVSRTPKFKRGKLQFFCKKPNGRRSYDFVGFCWFLFVFLFGGFIVGFCWILLDFVGFCWILLDFVVGFCWILSVFFFVGFCLFLVPSSPNIGANKKIQIHTYKLVLP